MQISKYKNLGSGWKGESIRHHNAKVFGHAGGLYAKDIRMNKLKNYEKPVGYKYYNHFCTDKGCYIIWSRDGKRFYIDGGKDSKLFSLPDTPFKKSSDAVKYLKIRLQKKGLYANSKYSINWDEYTVSEGKELKKYMETLPNPKIIGKDNEGNTIIHCEDTIKAKNDEEAKKIIEDNFYEVETFDVIKDGKVIFTEEDIE